VNPMKTATDVFGRWLMSSQPQDHYFLNGKPLCGAKLAAGEQRPGRHKTSAGDEGHPDVRHRCPACHRLNLKRWEKL
jgi:hypothetical protein